MAVNDEEGCGTHRVAGRQKCCDETARARSGCQVEEVSDA